MKIIDQLYDNIETTKIDELMAEQCASQTTIHTDYGILASRLIISNFHKNSNPSFSTVMGELYNFYDVHNVHYPIISDLLYDIVKEHGETLDTWIDHERDYLFDYFGFKTLERAYLFRKNKIPIERPQHMWLRVALGIHGNDLVSAKETYDAMSQKYFTHATPTLYNAGTLRPQLSSCYLIAMEEDSIDGIYNTLKDCANISKYAGGIGLHVHNVRASGTHIRGTNGTSNGIVPMLRVFNNTARYVDQGGGKRNGSFAIYLEPWHADVMDFLEMRKNHGDEEMKGRDLFYALWIPDLFMKRVERDEHWTLMCPDKCKKLSDVYGEEFDKLYTQYETNSQGNKVVKARDLWFRILDSQMETGTPYLLYKDACNIKSNQKNLGTIKSSNLCTEIIEYSSPNETAVCNLASIGLPSFVEITDNKPSFNFEKLENITKIITRNLNKIININFYPTQKTKNSNFRHRPIGIGVQGLADVFAMMDMYFDGEDAAKLNKKIFETIYYSALSSSNVLAMERNEHLKIIKTIVMKEKSSLLDSINDTSIEFIDYIENDTINKELWESLKPIKEEIKLLNEEKMGAYSSFIGSPISDGKMQFDLWNVSPIENRYDWDTLRQSIIKCGIRNSLLLAPMPTASTAQILGNNECFEPFTSNIYSRRTIAGEFMIVNKHLMKDLQDLGLYNETVKNNIIANKGSIQQLLHIPEHIRKKYKIVWEMSMKNVINMARDRGAYICQSQSMNLWQEDPTYTSLTSMHFYAWKAGLKTGMYYLRRKAKHQAQQFTIDPNSSKDKITQDNNEDNSCEMCSG
jgi:ribonucleoside-diphosphate reductase alpha subunit